MPGGGGATSKADGRPSVPGVPVRKEEEEGALLDNNGPQHNEIGNATLSLVVVEVIPLRIAPGAVSTTTGGGGAANETAAPTGMHAPPPPPPPPPLSAPLVKMQLKRLGAQAFTGELGGGGCSMRIVSDDEDRTARRGRAIRAGSVYVERTSRHRRQQPEEGSSSGRQRQLRPRQSMIAPTMKLTSDDPTDVTDGVSCWVRGYYYNHHAQQTPSSPPAPDLSVGRRCAVVAGTMVRILPPMTAATSSSTMDGSALGAATAADGSATYVAVSPVSMAPSLCDALSGEVDVDVGINIDAGAPSSSSATAASATAASDAESILSCYDPETVRALAVRMGALLARPVLVGTTPDAMQLWERRREKGRRLRRSIADWDAWARRRRRRRRPNDDGGDLSYEQEISCAVGQSTQAKSACQPGWPGAAIHADDGDGARRNTALMMSSFDDDLLHDGALTVHDPTHGSGKTLLVRTIARSVLGCHAVHTVQAGSLFAKYGVNGADAALESLLHGIVLSAAVRRQGDSRTSLAGWHRRKEKIGRKGEDDDDDDWRSPGSICIILDHLDAFVPPVMAGGSRSGGDPSLPALNAIVAYLTKLTKSLKRKDSFPYPTKNAMYNLGGANGFVLPVRVCLVGVVTCDDDGGRRTSRAAAAGDFSTVLDVLGNGRYRLPQLSSRARRGAFLRAFRIEGVQLSVDAQKELPVLAASAVNARGGSFRKVARQLREVIEAREGTEDSEATLHDVRSAMSHLSTRPSSRTAAAAGISFLSSRRKRGEAQNGTGDMFASVGGNADAKVALENALALDPRKRRILSAFGLSPPTGVLLYGPPGTGKTLLAKATAQALNSENPGGISGVGGVFISLRASEIVRAEVGNSEKMVVSAFELAQANTPAVVFIDEFQALFTERGGRGGGNQGGSGRLASTLLQCMDDISRWRDADASVAGRDTDGGITSELGRDRGRVVVLGATNTPWMVDRAFLRPGRFDRVVHVGLPNLAERECILQVHVVRMKICEQGGIANVDAICQRMAKECDGFSGADLAALCRAAAVRCLREKTIIGGVQERHFADARKHDLSSSSSKEMVKRLLSWSPNKVESF